MSKKYSASVPVPQWTIGQIKIHVSEFLEDIVLIASCKKKPGFFLGYLLWGWRIIAAMLNIEIPLKLPASFFTRYSPGCCRLTKFHSSCQLNSCFGGGTDSWSFILSHLPWCHLDTRFLTVVQNNVYFCHRIFQWKPRQAYPKLPTQSCLLDITIIPKYILFKFINTIFTELSHWKQYYIIENWSLQSLGALPQEWNLHALTSCLFLANKVS